MRQRTRKLIGTVTLMVFVPFYALVAMSVASARLGGTSTLTQTFFFADRRLDLADPGRRDHLVDAAPRDRTAGLGCLAGNARLLPTRRISDEAYLRSASSFALSTAGSTIRSMIVADETAVILSKAWTVRGSAAPNSLTTIAASTDRPEDVDHVVARVHDQVVVGLVERPENRRHSLAVEHIRRKRQPARRNEMRPRTTVAEDHLREGGLAGEEIGETRKIRSPRTSPRRSHRRRENRSAPSDGRRGRAPGPAPRRQAVVRCHRLLPRA